MKIAYYLHLNMGVKSGVYKKILSQMEIWHQLGHIVSIYIVTKLDDISEDLKKYDGIYKVYVHKYGSKIFPPPLDGRLIASMRTILEINAWGPDIVYTRQDMYMPSIEILLNSNRVIVEINTDDLSETADLPAILKNYYKLTRGRLLSQAKGLIYVSKELSFNTQYLIYKKPYVIIGNGIKLLQERNTEINKNKRPSIVFIGHPKQSWQGVDKIIRLALLKPEWDFHIIGTDAEDINYPIPTNIRFHGYLATSEYNEILKKSDCALGTLALHRKNMDEASPLKVREYLAHGIPVIIGYLDTDFPDGAEFLLRLPNEENNVENHLKEIETFVTSWLGKRIPTNQIQRINYETKEAERVDFFSNILLNE